MSSTDYQTQCPAVLSDHCRAGEYIRAVPEPSGVVQVEVGGSDAKTSDIAVGQPKLE
ncbi:MAG: hypothetical protein L0Z50_30715 [Verrucomicrobiales bacterium]|nr:hypothetical protein [Verrucomicrobiales bacterium]